MLRYTKKGIESKERIGTLPLRMSSLLRYRGVNTPEEAERFLHPRLTDLLDPSTMPGMEKAVSIICQAVREQWGITIYGDTMSMASARQASCSKPCATSAHSTSARISPRATKRAMG